jgi:hypothetical protein
LATGCGLERCQAELIVGVFVLQGEMHFEASNGDSQRIAAGRAVLLEDTVGAAVRLPDEGPALLKI